MNADTDTYERTVIASHRIYHKYIRDHDILDRNIKRYKNNDWDEGAELDYKEILDVEDELWVKMYPEQARAKKKRKEILLQIVPTGNDPSLEVANKESEASSDFSLSSGEENKGVNGEEEGKVCGRKKIDVCDIGLPVRRDEMEVDETKDEDNSIVRGNKGA